MNNDSIIFDRAAAEQAINHWSRSHAPEGMARELFLLDDVFGLLTEAGAVTCPESVSVIAEEHRVDEACRVRIVVTDHRTSPAIGVTSDHDRNEFDTHRISDQEALATVAQLVGHANDLMGALRALRVGEARIKGEVDYSDPESLMVLLENRECEILDRAAVEAAVAADPGPFLYGDIDLCDDGGTWENTGARWANRLEARLAEQGAIKCP